MPTVLCTNFICKKISADPELFHKIKSVHRNGQRLAPRTELIRVYDQAGNVIETHEQPGEFKGDFVTRLGKRHARA
jgi:hypothetical protein